MLLFSPAVAPLCSRQRNRGLRDFFLAHAVKSRFNPPPPPAVHLTQQHVRQ
jgi:hypothetical protein